MKQKLIALTLLVATLCLAISINAHAWENEYGHSKYGQGAKLYAPDNSYRGHNGSRYDSNSINNPYGRYGSKYSSDSIRNPYGQYGSKYSSDGYNNPYGGNNYRWSD